MLNGTGESRLASHRGVFHDRQSGYLQIRLIGFEQWTAPSADLRTALWGKAIERLPARLMCAAACAIDGYLDSE
jgi:hypothetical protein